MDQHRAHEPVLASLPHMARMVGVTCVWLRAEADAGRVPCLRAGDRYLFSPVAVKETLADRAARQEVAR